MGVELGGKVGLDAPAKIATETLQDIVSTGKGSKAAVATEAVMAAGTEDIISNLIYGK
jgi:hypothetical protein